MNDTFDSKKALNEDNYIIDKRIETIREESIKALIDGIGYNNIVRCMSDFNRVMNENFPNDANIASELSEQFLRSAESSTKVETYKISVDSKKTTSQRKKLIDFNSKKLSNTKNILNTIL